MKLEKRKYKGTDILSLSFKAAPFPMVLQTFLTIMEAVIPTSVMAVSTAFFVDTAIKIFRGKLASYAIYMPLGILISVVGITSILGSLSKITEDRIKAALDREIIPAILNIQANLSYRYIEDASSWELIERVADEMTEIFLEGIRSYGAVARSIIAVISILFLIIVEVWWAALLIIAFSIPLFYVSLWAGKRNYRAKVETMKYERRYSYYSDEVLTNREALEERTLFGYADNITDRFYKDFETSCKIQLKVLLKTRLAMKATSISLVVITLITAFIFIKPVISGKITPGIFMGIINALFGMVETLGWQLQDAAKNITEANEYMEDVTTLVGLENTAGATDLPDTQTAIFESLEFIDVYFKYPGKNEYILKNLSFKMECGRHYSLVGSNGAGKTTITKLLTGLYKDYEGKILINGKELRTYPISSIKGLFSVIYQDFARYQISLAENIALGKSWEKISSKEIVKTAYKAGLKETIKDLPYGIDTPLGKIKEEGSDISGGQWQKVAIARSLLNSAPVKILDEPTSALDPIAENKIYEEFEELMKGKTTIFISHRLGSTKLADEILVIDGGSVAEKGSHIELMKTEGIYARMFNSQKGWYK